MIQRGTVQGTTQTHDGAYLVRVKLDSRETVVARASRTYPEGRTVSVEGSGRDFKLVEPA